MQRLNLRPPTPADEAQVMAYRAELLASGSDFDGCAGLEETEVYSDWLDFEGRLSKKYGDEYVPSSVYLAIRIEDGHLVGILDFRHPLSDFLLRFGGSIGYSVRPADRRQGYAKEMLALALPLCRAAGERRVLVCCDPANDASRRTIVANGGVLENEVADTVGLTASGVIQRYWIEL